MFIHFFQLPLRILGTLNQKVNSKISNLSKTASMAVFLSLFFTLPVSALEIPLNITVTTDNAHYIQITADYVDGMTGFRIYNTATPHLSDTYVLVGEIPGGSISYRDYQVRPGAAMYYLVQVFSDTEESDLTEAVRGDKLLAMGEIHPATAKEGDIICIVITYPPAYPFGMGEGGTVIWGGQPISAENIRYWDDHLIEMVVPPRPADGSGTVEVSLISPDGIGVAEIKTFQYLLENNCEYQAGYDAGMAFCQNDPASCGIVSENNYPYPSIDTEKVLHIPYLVYGNMEFSMLLRQVDHPSEVYFALDSFEVISAVTNWMEADYDGDGFTPQDGDCNDHDASVYPGAQEIFGDGIDQDCSTSLFD